MFLSPIIIRFAAQLFGWSEYYDTSGQIVFIRFLEELKTQKRHFDINWPLTMPKIPQWSHFLPNVIWFSLCHSIFMICMPLYVCKIISINNLNTKSNDIKKNMAPMHIAHCTVTNPELFHEIKSLSWVAIKNWHSIKNTKVYKNFGRIRIEDNSRY